MSAARLPPSPPAAPRAGRPARGRRPVSAASLLALLAAVLVAAGGAALGMAAPAHAHAGLVRTEPADGAVVATPVQTVTLSYSENVRERFTTVLVTGADGTRYGDGPARVTGASVRQAVRPLPSGAYTVAWRTVSADGHPIEGRFAFRVDLPVSGSPAQAAPGTPEPSGTAAPTGPADSGSGRAAGADPGTAADPDGGSGGSGPLWWLGGAAAVAAAAVAVPLAVRRRARPGGGAGEAGR